MLAVCLKDDVIIHQIQDPTHADGLSNYTVSIHDNHDPVNTGKFVEDIEASESLRCGKVCI